MVPLEVSLYLTFLSYRVSSVDNVLSAGGLSWKVVSDFLQGVHIIFIVGPSEGVAINIESFIKLLLIIKWSISIHSYSNITREDNNVVIIGIKVRMISINSTKPIYSNS